YSRIYNGVHYPADISVGALLGIVVGIIMYKTFLLIDNRITHE
ncbi:MAG: phosphatase PAP2 family protein, partial [Bacteroidia bacterium]|nr:phosphatase PAP2 family protein [Bacteroidia bacterium]